MPDDPKQIRLTPEGFKQLQHELEFLRAEQRPQLTAARRRLELLVAPGDSVQALEGMKIDLQSTERRIEELETILQDAEIISGPVPPTASLGTAVTVRYDDGADETFTLVEELQVDLPRGYIALTSPLASALLGKRDGDEVTVGSGEDRVKVRVEKIGWPPETVTPEPLPGPV